MPVTVAECEISEAVIIRANQSVRAAAKLMESHGTELLVVVDEESIAGVVTAKDLIWRVYAQGGTGNDQIRGVCDHGIVTAAATDRVSDVVARVRAADACRVLVQEDGRLVGTLTREDLAVGNPKVRFVSPHLLSTHFAQNRELVGTAAS